MVTLGTSNIHLVVVSIDSFAFKLYFFLDIFFRRACVDILCT